MSLTGKNRNVILICLDTVRKDYFDDYASHLRENSDLSFENCRAASSWSVPSHGSMVSGKLPHQHGVHKYNQDFSSIDLEDSLFGDLVGYNICGVSANAFASATFGFDVFFDELQYMPSSKFLRGHDPIDFFHNYNGSPGAEKYISYIANCFKHENTIGGLFNGVLYKLTNYVKGTRIPNVTDDGGKRVLKSARSQTRDQKEPFFQFINMMDAHAPFSPHVWLDDEINSAPTDWFTGNIPFGSEVNLNGRKKQLEEDILHYRNIYTASIEYLDRIVFNYISDIADETNRETTVIITSDHGQNLAYPSDGDMIGHKGSISDGLLHVPLEIFNPPQKHKHKHTDFFSHLDLRRLINNLAQGDSAEIKRNKIPAERIGSQGTDNNDLTNEQQKYWGRGIRCVYKGPEKIEWDSIGNRKKYRIDDACSQLEMKSIDDIPEWAKDVFSEDLNEYITNQINSADQYTDVDEGTKKRLRKLGYL